MSASSARLRWLLGALVLALGTALFFTTCERKTEEIAVGFQGEARRNPYLAAQRMLERMGLEVRAIDGLAELADLPPTQGTLIVPTPRRTLSEARTAELRQWVERGGHLVVLAWTDWEEGDQRDLLLDDLDVRQIVRKDEFGDREQADPNQADGSEASGSGDAVDLKAVAHVRFPDRDEPLQAAFDPLYRLERPSDDVRFEISDVNGTHLMQIDLGRGLLTVLTDDYLMRNDTIDELDHAELLWRLVHSEGHASPVWIVFNEDVPGLLALLWTHAWMVVLSLGALLAGWLWQASRRFGPITPDESLERRRLMEHVEASGRFQWRRGARAELLEDVRAALMERVRERHPGWTRLNPSELARRLAELSGLPDPNVTRALAFRREVDRDTFARDIATLERIRGSL